MQSNFMLGRNTFSLPVDAQTVIGFLKHYGLDKDYKVCQFDLLMKVS